MKEVEQFLAKKLNLPVEIISFKRVVTYPGYSEEEWKIDSFFVTIEYELDGELNSFGMYEEGVCEFINEIFPDTPFT